MYYVVANAAEECASDRTHTPGSCDDKISVLIVCNFADYLPWASTNAFHFTARLKIRKNKIVKLIELKQKLVWFIVILSKHGFQIYSNTFCSKTDSKKYTV
jgi:hypothetical protein